MKLPVPVPSLRATCKSSQASAPSAKWILVSALFIHVPRNRVRPKMRVPSPFQVPGLWSWPRIERRMTGGRCHSHCRRNSFSSGGAILSKFYGAGNLDRGRRLKFNADKWLAQSERVEKSFQIQTAAGLETRAAALHIPIHAPGKTAHVIAPFAMSDGQLLIVPFCNCGEVSHFVVAPLQSIASKGCLDMCLLELSDVPAKFYL